MEQHLLTTIDNPYNPFVDFSSWYMFDCEKGHNTSARLARIANIDCEMTQKEIDEETERAMNLIAKYDFEDKYVLGTEEQINKIIETYKENKKSIENEEKIKENQSEDAREA